MPAARHALRYVVDAMRWRVKAGCPWRMLPGDFPPWQAVEQQAKRWMEAGCFEIIVHDLREMLRLLVDRNPRPTAAFLDGRTLQISPDGSGRTGYDGYLTKFGAGTLTLSGTNTYSGGTYLRREGLRPRQRHGARHLWRRRVLRQRCVRSIVGAERADPARESRLL